MTTVAQPYRAAERRPPTAHLHPPPPERYRPLTHVEWRKRQVMRVLPVLAALVVYAVMTRLFGTLVGIVFVAAWLFVVVISLEAMQRANRVMPKVGRAVELLDAGRAEEAAAIYEQVIDRVRGAPTLHSSLLMQLALAWVRLGKIDDALSVLHAVRLEGWLDGHATYYVLAAGIAGAHACLGELDDAVRWRKVAHGRVPLAARRHLAVLDAVLDARSGRFEEVTARLDATWLELEAEFAKKAYPMKVLRLVRAFALDACPAGATRANEVRAWIEAARGTPGEIAHHRKTWPAFDTFLATNGIS